LWASALPMKEFSDKGETNTSEKKPERKQFD